MTTTRQPNAVRGVLTGLTGLAWITPFWAVVVFMTLNGTLTTMAAAVVKGTWWMALTALIVWALSRKDNSS